MISIGSNGSRRGSRQGGFTLVEIIVALTVIAVIAAVAIPVLKGINQQDKLEGPIKTLAEMVMETRQRAMRERRAHQIVFERGGIHALQGNRSYADRQDFLKHLEELRTPPPVEVIERMEPEKTEPVRTVTPRSGEVAKAPPPPPEPPKPKQPEMPWTISLTLEENTECGVLLWGDGEAERMEGDRVRRWVFQPSGMASPATVRLQAADIFREASFDVLTGEINAERAGPRKDSYRP